MPRWFHIGMLVISAPFIANFAFADLGLSEDDRKQALVRLAQLESDPALDHLDDVLLRK
jgi:hypothetical protein